MKKAVRYALLLACLIAVLVSLSSAAFAAGSGWQKNNGQYSYVDASGKTLTGWQKIDGKWYYLGSDGIMRTGWQQVGGKWYYLRGTGEMLTGWQEIGGKWYYLGSDGAMRTKWQEIGGKWYYLGSDGAMQTKWQQIGGKWYYLGSDGAMCTKWQQVGKKWYYLGSDGAMQTGWQKIGKKWYYLGSDGAMRTDWQKVGGEWYYLGADGAMRTDWQKIGKKWYYFGSDGMMWTGWLGLDDADGYDDWYYFDPNGAMVTGWYWATDSWTDPETGESETYNYWIYMDPDGKGHEGFLVENGRTYYISYGEMATGLWGIDPDNDGNYYTYCFREDGSMITGWHYYEESWTDPETGKTESWSAWYYFDADGKGHNGWLEEKGRSYFIYDGMMCTGAQWIDPDRDGNYEYYRFDDDGAPVTGWYEDRWSWTDPETGESGTASAWYYFDADGKGHNGWLVDNGHTYYCSNGWMATGWCETDDGWHYFSENGRLADPTMTNDQKKNASKVKDLAYYTVTESNYYDFNFKFEDANGNAVTNIPCLAEVEIFNDDGERVYWGMTTFTDISDEWYSCTAWSFDIEAGNVDSGWARVDISIPGYFEEYFIEDLSGLPTY